MSTPQDKLNLFPEEKDNFQFRTSADLPDFQSPQVTPKPGWGGAVVSAIAPVVDILSRGQYASAKFFDGLADPSLSILDNISQSLGEIIDPQYRLSFSDVIKRRAPEFARQNPKATSVLGFLGDLVGDPVTYLGVGLGNKGVKIGGKVLTKFGFDLLEKTENKLANRILLTAPGGVQGEVARDVAKAASRDIIATPSKISEFSFQQEAARLSTEYADELIDLGYDPAKIKNAADKLALKELDRITLNVGDQTGVFRKLSVDEVTERAEQRIMRLASLDPEIGKQIFKPEKISLKFSLPFVPSSEITIASLPKEVVVTAGLYPLKRSIDFVAKLRDLVVDKDLGFVSRYLEKTKGLGEAASQVFGRPSFKPYKDIVTELQNSLDYVTQSIVRTTAKLFDKVPEDRRIVIGTFMRDVDDATRVFEASAGRNVTQIEADKIYNDALAKNQFNNQEMAIIATMQQDYRTAMELEMGANLLKGGIANYSPRYYEMLNDPSTVTFLTSNKYGLSTFMPSSMERSYLTQQQAIAMGLVPELDAATLYAQRVLSSRRKQSIAQFQDSLRTIYGIPGDVEYASKEFAKYLPDNIINDLKLMGESVYPTGMNSSQSKFLKLWDASTALYKQGATVFKLSFAPRQLVANTLQSILAGGVENAKAFNPLAMVDSIMMLQGLYRNTTKQLPKYYEDFFKDFLNKGGEGTDAILASRAALGNIFGEEAVQDYAQGYIKKTVRGQEWTGTQLIESGRRNGIIRGFDVTGDRFTKSLAEKLEYDPNNKWTVTKELSKWWQWGGVTEDYSRFSHYINLIGMGYSEKQAAQEVNKALFDYVHGLSYLEKRVIARIVPFYQFQKMAFPFVLRQGIENPGQVAAMSKVVNLFEKLLVTPEDSLNPSEREVFGSSFLIEQPRVYTGFDKSGKAKFNVFNNLTPFEVLGFMVNDKQTGELDLRRTVEKTFLAALTPFLKVPLESALDRQFFSGRTISDAGGLGNLKGGVADTVISSILPEPIRRLIGYENRVDMRTGETRTFINPYLAYYSLNAVPALRQFITPLGTDTVLEGAMNIITGITPYKVDLKAQQEWQELGAKNELTKLVGELKRDKIKGAQTEFEKDYEAYKEFIATFTAGRAKKREFEVRGLGIGQAATGAENEQANPLEQVQEQK